MAYAAVPAAQPITAPAAPAEEAKPPPTIDSHGGKLTVMNHCYLDGASSILFLMAILSALSPRRLKSFGREVDLAWTRLAPGLLLSGLAAWNLVPSIEQFTYPGLGHYLQIKTIHVGALFAFAFLSLVADAIIPVKPGAAVRGVIGMAASGLGLLILLGVSLIDWYGQRYSPVLSFDPATVLLWLTGIPVGLGLLLLWRRFDGKLFDGLLLAGVLASVIATEAFVPWEFRTGVLGLHLVALTVTATLGTGLRSLGAPEWRTFTGRAAWTWAWIMRCCVVALTAC